MNIWAMSVQMPELYKVNSRQKAKVERSTEYLVPQYFVSLDSGTNGIEIIIGRNISFELVMGLATRDTSSAMTVSTSKPSHRLSTGVFFFPSENCRPSISKCLSGFGSNHHLQQSKHPLVSAETRFARESTSTKLVCWSM